MKLQYPLLVLFCSSLGCSADPAGLKELTGAPARAAWVQDISEKSSDAFAEGDSLQLMGYCTEDNKGERIIVRGPAGITRPIITSDGRKVVYTRPHSQEFFIVDFNGKNNRKLGTGFALDIRLDPQTGIDWLYYGDKPAKGKGLTYGTVRKMPIHTPSAPDTTASHEEVWSTAPVSVDNFQVSRDGTRACGLFPWPDGGVAVLPDKGWTKYQRGCWTSLAPDNSYLLWVFDGAHRNLTMKFTKDDPGWTLNIANAPGISGFEAYHPRWSNHARFMTLTGPYIGDGGKPGGNRIRAGGTAVEVYAGKFNEKFTAITEWKQVTNNKQGDFFPDLWISNGEKSNVADTLQPPAGSKGESPTLPENKTGIQRNGAWPGNTHGLVFLWDNVKSDNQIPMPDGKTFQCRLEDHGYARYGRYYEMILSHGYTEALDSNERLLSMCKETGALSIEAFITSKSDEQQELSHIISFAGPESSGNFMLGQERDNLIIRLSTAGSDGKAESKQIELCKIRKDTGMHIIFSYADGLMTCYVDGKEAKRAETIKGGFSSWTAQPLTFGAAPDGSRDWHGSLEAVAMYNRPIDPTEAAAAWKLFAGRLAKRAPAKTVKVQAELLGIPDIPDPKDIRPYTRCLAQARFRLTDKFKDIMPEQEFVTALWVLMDSKKIETIPQAGAILELELENFEDNPQLKSERAALNPDDALLDLYYDQRPVDRIPVITPN